MQPVHYYFKRGDRERLICLCMCSLSSKWVTWQGRLTWLVCHSMCCPCSDMPGQGRLAQLVCLCMCSLSSTILWNGWHAREGLPGLSVSACVVCPPLLWNGWHARESLPVYVYFKWAPKEPCLSICVNCEQCMPIIVCTVQGPADWGALSDTCHVHARMGILPVYLWLLNQCCFS